MTPTSFRKFLLLCIFINALLAPQGVCAQSTADQEQELRAIERKLKTAPNDFYLKLKHAQILGDSKRFADELQEGRELVKLRPEDPEAYAVLQQAYTRLSLFSDALNAADRLIQLGVDTPQVHAMRCANLCSLKRYRESVAEGNKAFHLAATNPASQFDRALTHYFRAKALYRINGASDAVISELEEANASLHLASVEALIAQAKAELQSSRAKSP